MAMLWTWLATPGASLIAGCLCLAMLCVSGKHRSNTGQLDRVAVASSVMLTAMLYTLIILVIGEFFLGRPVSATIRDGFGDTRVAWLLVALGLDTGARIAALFDP